MNELLEAIRDLTATIRESQEKEERLVYSTSELAQVLNTHPNRINMLREEGAITGVRNGKEWIFEKEEAELFLKTFRGMDLSNQAKVKEAVRKVKLAGIKKGLPGRTRKGLC